MPELREAIAKDVGSTRNIPVSPDEIVVTPGAKPIMYFVITALINPGDEVIYPNPGFPIYESVINFVGGRAIGVPLREATGFNFDMDFFEAVGKLRAYRKIWARLMQERYGAKTPEALLQACLQLKLEAEPGERAEYSDPGFILLGKALEALTGKHISSWTRREIFDPLEMSATRFEDFWRD